MPVSSTTPTSSAHAMAPLSRRRTPRVINANEVTGRFVHNLLPPLNFTYPFSGDITSTGSSTNANMTTTIRNNYGNTRIGNMFTQVESLQRKFCHTCRNHSGTCHCNKHDHLTSSSSNRKNRGTTKNNSSSSSNHSTPSIVSQQQLTLNDSNTNTALNSNHVDNRGGSWGKMAEKQKQKIRLLTSRNDDDRWVNLSDQRVGSGNMGHLYSGSQFTGVQKGAACNYDVSLDILHVDLENDVLCGYLHVTGLTTLPPKITTYFEGEIIGRKHSFLTRKWLADLSVDSKHWKRFPSFAPFADTFNDDDFSYDSSDQDFVYMRWKEKFLVPNHHVNSIDGASYAGFYYICYQRSTESINGFYYCRNNIEWFQELILSHVPERCFSRFEFR